MSNRPWPHPNSRWQAQGELRDVLENIWPSQPPSTIDGSGSHVAAETDGADSAGVVFLWPSSLEAELAAVEASASRSARVFLTRVACVAAGRSSTELLAEEIDTTDGALMLTTAEEFEEQWLTMTDCTDEGWEACESVSEYDRFAFGAPPASCWRMERSGGRLKLGGLELLDAWRLSGLRTANCASHSHLTVVNSCSRTAWSFQPQEGQTNVARTRRRI